MAKRERLTGIETKQIFLKIPVGMYDEIIRIVEQKKMWSSLQEFIRYALITELRRQELEEKDR